MEIDNIGGVPAPKRSAPPPPQTSDAPKPEVNVEKLREDNRKDRVEITSQRMERARQDESVVEKREVKDDASQERADGNREEQERQQERRIDLTV